MAADRTRSAAPASATSCAGRDRVLILERGVNLVWFDRDGVARRRSTRPSLYRPEAALPDPPAAGSQLAFARLTARHDSVPVACYR